MLQTQTIESGTLDLLKKLMSLEILEPYYLAGGTALALQIGHRMSYDLDFFGKFNIPHELVLEQLNQLGEVIVTDRFDTVSRFEVNKIKVDIVRYRYNLLKPLINIDGVRMASLEDIAAMKIYAIVSRGVKRDFFDLYAFLEIFPLTTMIDLAMTKYPESIKLHIMRSLTFFDDAEEDSDPRMFKTIVWEEVKDKVRKEVKRIAL